MPHAFRHLLLRECPSRGHKEDHRATPPSQPRSGGRQGHTRLEKWRGPSPAAPAGRQGPAEVPLQEEACAVLGSHLSAHRLAGRGRHPPGMRRGLSVSEVPH